MSFFKSVAFLVGMLVPKDTLCLGFEEWWQPGYRIVCYLFRDTGMDSTTEEVCDLYCIFIFTDAYDVDTSCPHAYIIFLYMCTYSLIASFMPPHVLTVNPQEIWVQAE